MGDGKSEGNKGRGGLAQNKALSFYLRSKDVGGFSDNGGIFG